MAQRKEPSASLSSSSDPLLLQHSPPFDQTFLFRDTFRDLFRVFRLYMYIYLCIYVYWFVCFAMEIYDKSGSVSDRFGSVGSLNATPSEGFYVSYI